MAFSINDFKANGLVLGGARPTLFQVLIPNFPTLSGSTVGFGTTNGPTLTGKVQLLAKAASLPPSLVDSIDVGYMGRKIKVTGDRTFPNWACTIMNDEDFKVRNVFEDWHEILNSREPNLLTRVSPSSGSSNGSTDPNNYKRDITIIQFSKAGQEIKIYTLIGAFPVTVSPIALDYDATNQIEQFDVEFAYDYWEPTDASTIGLSDAPTPSLSLNIGS
jgi:hypothetical protein